MKFEISVSDEVVDQVKSLLHVEREITPEALLDDPSLKYKKEWRKTVETEDELKEYIEKYINNYFECLIGDQKEREKSIYIKKDVQQKLKRINRRLDSIAELICMIMENVTKEDE